MRGYETFNILFALKRRKEKNKRERKKGYCSDMTGWGDFSYKVHAAFYLPYLFLTMPQHERRKEKKVSKENGQNQYAFHPSQSLILFSKKIPFLLHIETVGEAERERRDEGGRYKRFNN